MQRAGDSLRQIDYTLKEATRPLLSLCKLNLGDSSRGGGGVNYLSGLTSAE